jgi:hypothetical protein
LANGRLFNQASFRAIAALASARLVNRRLASHGSAINTPTSAVALSRGPRFTRAGKIAVP